MVVCPRAAGGCAWTSPEGENGAIVALLLKDHLDTIHPAAANVKAPPLPQPKLVGRVHDDVWDIFKGEFNVFKAANNIPQDRVNMYLITCCDSELKASVQKETPDLMTKTEAEVLEAIKRQAVITVATCVLQTELVGLKQENNETIRQFLSRAR